MKNHQTTTKGFAILGAASIINKILAIAYAPIQLAIIGKQGIGIINVGFTIYVFIFILANAGIPTAISKMIAEQYAIGNHVGTKKIFQISLKVMMILGVGSSFGLAMSAGKISSLLNYPNAQLMLVVLAPTLIFASAAGALRGYFQGYMNMIPTSISQILEQLLNSIFTVLFVAWFNNIFFANNLEGNEKSIALGKVAAGSSLATLLASIGALIYLVIIYKKNKNERAKFAMNNSIYNGKQLTTKEILKQLMKFAIPAIVGMAALNSNYLTDLLIKKQLVAIGISGAKATAMFGVYANNYMRILNLPLAIAATLPAVLIPSIASYKANSNIEILKSKIVDSYRLIFLIILPVAVVLTVLAKPIIWFVFFSSKGEGNELMMIGAGVILLISINYVQSAILTGLGKPHIPSINIFIGMSLKVVLLFYLTSNREINIKGAIIGTILGYLLALIMNQVAIKKRINITLNLSKIFIKTLSIAGAMGVIAVFVFEFLKNRLHIFIHSSLVLNDLALIITIIIASIFYITMLILLKEINSHDIIKLPFGYKVNRWLVKIPVLKKALGY